MITATIPKQDLPRLFDALHDAFTIIGPKVKAGVVVLEELDTFQDMPLSFEDRQAPGFYRLDPGDGSLLFSFSLGPDSFKRFLHPAVREEYIAKRSRGRLQMLPTSGAPALKPLAFFAMRACDLAALHILDKVFLKGPVKDRRYEAVRNNIFIVAVNCVRPGEQCFCHSVGTGPEARCGYDIALTELENAFLVEISSQKAKDLLRGIQLTHADEKHQTEKFQRMEYCIKHIPKMIQVKDLPRIIFNHLEHPRWAETAIRCLGCGNCTQVCPTCFCSTTHDKVPLAWVSKTSSVVSSTRIRTWDSCFSVNFARVHGGNFRPSRRARFRHWVSHKLAYWVDQFGTLGCVGCGRCITWCPVGIDITEECKALASARSTP
ncbi:MAG: 4Fe-4S dicluster domain-containing protein [Desulfosoma sp.]